MIFPFLIGLVHPMRAPLTYFLLFINLIVFVANYDSYNLKDEQMETLLSDDSFIEAQAFVFAHLIQSRPEHFSPVLQKLSRQVASADPDAKRMLGNLALRNSDFMTQAQTIDVAGDEILLSQWRTKFTELLKIQEEHPSYQWGVSQHVGGWRQWITYQFAHSGSAHLFWNMIFLMVFGCFVEVSLGSSFVVFTYLGAGLFGAFTYSCLSGISASPLVGASAAVTGLMGLVVFAWWNSPGVRFFYWLLPIRGYFGFRHLPSWVVILISFLPDLSGYLGTNPDLGSVAYSAHLGGAAFGGFMAFVLSKGWLVRENEEINPPPVAF